MYIVQVKLQTKYHMKNHPGWEKMSKVQECECRYQRMCKTVSISRMLGCTLQQNQVTE